jgi:hypothetical protein
MRRSCALIVALLVAGGLAAGAGAASSGSTAKRCVLSATGALGDNAGGVAGGIAQKNGAKASLSILCSFLASGVKIKIPGHTLAMSTFVHALPGRCSQAGDTVTCKLDTKLQRTGITYGGWKDSFAWKFTPEDSTSKNTRDGSCHVPLVVTLTNAGVAAYSQKTQTVCEFAQGDALR